MSVMHYLVVCGAFEADEDADAALFGDFMGLSRTLQTLHTSISGTFLSCFPLEEHFAILEKEKRPIKNVKFGQDKDGNPLYIQQKTARVTDRTLVYPLWHRRTHCESDDLVPR